MPISCASWGKLGRLLDERRAGRTKVCVRGIPALEPGEDVAVALRLPDEIVLSIDAVVESTRQDPRTGEAVTYLDFVGLDETLVGRLEELCLSRVA